MKSYIVINKKIYEKYKDAILPLSARLFCEPYFYDISNYEVPLDLKGLENFLSFTKEIEIYTTSTFIDFINILLVLDFLKNKEFKGNVKINYLFLNGQSLNNSIFVNTNLTLTDYNDVGYVLKAIKEGNTLPKFSNKLIGYINYQNFYNMLIDGDKFIFSLSDVIDKYDEDIDLIASYLEDKYSNMGLNKEFYLKFLEKYM